MSSGMLCAMPGIHSLRNIKRLVTEAESREVAAHVGASCYLRTGTEPFVVDQNRNEFKTAMVCAGAYIKIVAPCSTLAQSPAFAGAEEA